MIITIEDILTYSYCPMLLKRGKKDILLPKLSLVESTLKKTFIEAEREACIRDSITNPKRLLCAWEKLWWPIAASNNIAAKEAESISLDISGKFSEYCKYDISDWTYPTVGVNIENHIQVDSAAVVVHADILKVNLEINDPNMVIINFSTRVLSPRALSLDPYTLYTVYGMYTGAEKTITYVSVNISENKKLSLVSSIYSSSEIEGLGKQFRNICKNIYNNNYYYNPFLCKECRVCQNLKVSQSSY